MKLRGTARLHAEFDSFFKIQTERLILEKGLKQLAILFNLIESSPKVVRSWTR